MSNFPLLNVVSPRAVLASLSTYTDSLLNGPIISDRMWYVLVRKRVDGKTGSAVLDTVEPSCSHNFILDRPVLSILYDILAVYRTHDLTMVLTAAQMITFFEHAEQMGIPHATVVQLQSEGITLVADLVNFDKDSLQQLADNLRCPGGHVPDPNPGAPPGSNSTICIWCQITKTYHCRM